MYSWFSKRLKQMFWFVSIMMMFSAYVTFSEDSHVGAGIVASITALAWTYVLLGLILGESINIKDDQIIIRNNLIRHKRSLKDLKLVGIAYYESAKYKAERKRVSFMFDNYKHPFLYVQYNYIDHQRLKGVLDEIKLIYGEDVIIDMLYDNI